MKNLTSMVLAISLLFTVAMFAKDASVDIKTNITCGGCVNSIETGLKDVDGIDKITANVETKVITIAYNDEKVSTADLTTKISDIGYTAELVEGGKTINTEPKACSTTKVDKQCGTKECCTTKKVKKS
jgi:copper chaperone